MNRKKKIHLLILLLLLGASASAYAALKLSGRGAAGEEIPQEQEDWPVTRIDSAQVKEIGIIGGEGSVNLIREEGGWKCLEDEETAIDEGAVEALLSMAVAITATEKIEDVTDLKQYGLVQPAVNVTLQWEDNMYIIRLGDYNPIIDCYYLRLNEENAVYTVDSSVFYGLNRSPEDFRKVESEN